VAPAVPRNRREIREALRSLGARPSPRRGQNFLADGRVLDRIADAAAPRPGDLVLEVGPGLGGLTARLAASGAEVAAVEIDPACAVFLRRAFAGEPRVCVVEADALDGHGMLSSPLASLLDHATGSVRHLVVSNLPYSIATPLILALLRRRRPPDDMVVMVQREVFQRLRALPSTRDFGPLSVLVQTVARVSGVLPVPRTAFYPVPAVESSVARITPDPALRAAAGDLDRLRTLVHAAFGRRRKTLGNALSAAGLADAAALRAAGVDPGRRAEALAPAEFVALAAALPSLASGGGRAEIGGASP